MFADLRAWTPRRRYLVAGVAIVAFAVIVLVAGLVRVTAAGLALPGDWWAIPAAAVGSTLVGTILASYTRTPIGADATLCDTRWPVFGTVALILATDTRSLAPVFTGVTRPIVALAAIALLVWALRERLAIEHRALARLAAAHGGDGEVCATCRPLFPRAATASSAAPQPLGAPEPLSPRSPLA